MLRNVSVKGFRSLADFDLEIRDGLNVLVGPNGAGKTNIILFFELLRSLARMSVSDAVAEAGGVAQVFLKKGKVRFQDQIQASVVGTALGSDIDYQYELTFSIKFNTGTQDVYFTQQTLRISRISDGGVYLNVTWSLGDADKPESDPLSVEVAPDQKKNFNWIIKHLRSPDTSKMGIFRQRLVLPIIASGGDLTRAVVDQIAGRFVLNVVPSHVKKPEDSTRRPGIESDGSGVSSTLYAIKRGKTFYDEGYHRGRALTVRYQDVIDLVKIAVPSINGIEVVNDPFDNLLRCQISVGTNGKSVVPLSSMSDGTVKWISLVLRLATSKSSLLLEEPENYLHPLMQREIVRLLRDGMAEQGFSMLSTHSETLLNAVRPDELVVVSHGRLGTKAKRVTNAAQVEEEINATGFGLGYYYLADAVES